MLHDPPFTKLDVLSCRNLLIYLAEPLQQHLFPLFHYALKPAGTLWLGTSETVPGAGELFLAADRKWKIYTRRATATTPLPTFDMLQPTSKTRTSKRRSQTPPPALAHGVEAMLLGRFAPATLIVNERGDIAYVHGRTGIYLELSPGEPRHNLFSMARDGLRLCLKSAIRAAALDDRESIHRGIPVKAGDGFTPVTVIVGRIREPETLRGMFRVSFAVTRSAAPAKPKKMLAKGDAGLAQAHYDKELKHTRESLRGTTDALQVSNEELKSVNEERQSTNEEVQSTNEELETSKEEMHALNEELLTLNLELQQKVDQLAQVNDDMQNLLNGTDIATVFLDRDLKIKRFTEQARRVVRLISTDVGRFIGDFVPQVHYPQLTDDASHVLATLAPHETEVQTLEGQWLLVRILPYRTAQNVIDGVVITFVDIDRLKRAKSRQTRTRCPSATRKLTHRSTLSACLLTS